MASSIKARLALLTTLICLLAFVIGWAAHTSWQEVGHLKEHFSRAHLNSFEIADHLQSTILQLESTLMRYELHREQKDWEDFRTNSQALNLWIDQKKPLLDLPRELELLNEIDAAYDNFIAAAENLFQRVNQQKGFGLDSSGRERVAEESARLLELGSKLEEAHRKVLEGFLSTSQKSVVLLQRVIFGALFVLLGLGIWMSSTVYREMIAPLRTRLVESQALIERHEKLASLGMLAAGVAHEIRNPLTAIKARLFTQQKMLKPGTPELADAEVIGQEINRLERIVKDFLQFARPADPQFVTGPADAPLREAASLLAPQLEKANIRLTLDSPPSAWMRVDPHQIKQVLINLIQNAADAIGQNGTVTLRLRLGTARLGGKSAKAVTLEVADTGTGIPPEVERRLFDPFFSTKESGTGLGLPIAARIVEKHGGALQYQTQVNRGTIFGIVLPRVEPDETSQNFTH